MQVHRIVGNAFRKAGQALDTFGRRFEVNPYVEKLQPCTKVVKLGKNTPKIDGAFLAQSASVIGRVSIGSNTSIWYGAILRGDVSEISVGSSCSIGDRVMVHGRGTIMTDKEIPTVIGNNVVVGAGAILHACTLKDNCMIGEGAQIMDGATVGKNSILAAGAVLTQGKSIPDGQVWAGVPAVYSRDATVAEISAIATTAQENLSLAIVHAEESVKTWEELEMDEYNIEQAARRNATYYPRLSKEEMSKRLGEVEGHMHPGRILNSPISSTSMPDQRPNA